MDGEIRAAGTYRESAREQPRTVISVKDGSLRVERTSELEEGTWLDV